MLLEELPFEPGFRLTDGDLLNKVAAEPAYSVDNTVTATGSGQSTAYGIRATVTIVTAGGDQAGLRLPFPKVGRILFIFNYTATGKRVYPFDQELINGAAAADIPFQGGMMLVCSSNSTWAASEVSTDTSGDIVLVASDADTPTSPGHFVEISGGAGGTTSGEGGDVNITGGSSVTDGGDISIVGGTATSGQGGNIAIAPGAGTPPGVVQVQSRLQTAGIDFWPPGNFLTFTGPQNPFFNLNASINGSITDTSQTVVAVNRGVFSSDTVAAPMTRGLTWLAMYGNIGWPFVWQANHAYVVNDQIAWHGRIYQVTIAGTSAASGGPTGVGGAIVDGSVTWAYRTPNNTGDRTGLYALLTVTSEAGDVTAGRAGGPVFVSVGGSVQCNYNQGGTDLVNNAAAGVWGCNFLANLGSGATNIGALVGAEISIEAAAGSSVKNKVGCQVVITSNDTVQATNGQSIGYFLANQTTQGVSSGWMTGLAFGDTVNGFLPLNAAGTLIKAGSQGGTVNASNGIDFRAVTFLNYSLMLPGFYVQGDNTSDAVMNRLTITPGSSSTIPINFSQSGTGQFQFNGNVGTTGFFTAANDTSMLLLGTTNTLGLQGGVQPEIQVQGTAKMFFLASGGFQFNGPFGINTVPIPIQVVTGSRGGNAALASFLSAMAAYGFITNSTTA